MSALKPASLTSALLTRKGMASPSAAPASRANMVELMQGQPPLPAETPPSPARPAPIPLRAHLSDRIRPKMSERKAGENMPTAPRSAEKRVRVSLRLDVDRHLRLKLVATHLNSTMQSVFTQAIDEYFERHTPDMLDAITLLRIRERGEKDGIEGERKSRGNRDAGEH
jgi:predicted transcriptional regulator